MQKKIYIEKKLEYADTARRLYHMLTDRHRMHGITEVRVLRCLILDGWESWMEEGGLSESLFFDPYTEHYVDQLELQRDAERENTVCISTLPLFRQPAERLTEKAIRIACAGICPDPEMPISLFVRQADVHLFSGALEPADLARIRQVLVNPASCAELNIFSPGGLPPLATAQDDSAFVVRGFRRMDDETLDDFSASQRYRMSRDDIRFVRSYFRVEEKRDPNFLEMRVIDSYWSDHCRHITFLTALQDLKIEDRDISRSFSLYLRVRESLYGTRPKNITLMELATIAASALRRSDRLPQFVETGEHHAMTIRATVETDAGPEPWLLHFKNETHNFPTEKEPFLGAETCFGATIGDLLAARGEIFCAMRLSGASDPRQEYDLRPGKQPQERLVTESADGFSSFGIQCGIPVGLVHEWLHPGYRVRHMEVCMAASAVPVSQWNAQRPIPGDVILLIGSETGRDGLGGVLNMAASANEQVGRTVPLYHKYTAQVAEPQTARALVRFLRRPDVMHLIKRASDIGAGGLSAAAAELADGVRIDLDKVPTTHFDTIGGAMNAYEIAASETQERMLLVLPSIHAETLMAFAAEEDLPTSLIGIVTAERRVRMLWHDRTVLSLSRDFLDSTGAEKRISAWIPASDADTLYSRFSADAAGEDIAKLFYRVLQHPDVRAQHSLSLRFDCTAGGRTAFLPFGGQNRMTPMQYMAVRFPADTMEHRKTETCAVFSYGFSPELMEKSPYHGAYLSVLSAVCRMAASGIPPRRMTLSLQEFFPAVQGNSERYGVILAAMLGAFQAQMDLEVGAVGGKDSMSGTDTDGDVPPTLIAFAASSAEQSDLLTPEFKHAGSRVYLLMPAYGENHLPDSEDEQALFAYLETLHTSGKMLACKAVEAGGVAAAVAQMCFGNGLGFNFEHTCSTRLLFEERYGAFLVETEEPIKGMFLGFTKDAPNLFIDGRTLSLSVLEEVWRQPQNKQYASYTENECNIVAAFPCTEHMYRTPAVLIPSPHVLLPVFPGISGEDTLAARFAAAGFEPEFVQMHSRRPSDTAESIHAFADALRRCRILAFADGSYPSYSSSPSSAYDPAALYMASVCTCPALRELLHTYREREENLLLGIGEGFRMLLASNLFGTVTAPAEDIGGADGLRLTENPGGYFAAQLVRIKVMSVHSPWMRHCEAGDLFTFPTASKAGRCLIPDEAIFRLAEKGQIAAQYVDANGNPTMDRRWNPYASDFAVESIFSADGRVYGGMVQFDRIDNTLAGNTGGNRDFPVFRSAFDYYKPLKS